MADRLDVLLGILLDKAAQKDAERGIEAIEKAVGKLDDAELIELNKELEKSGKSIHDLAAQFTRAREQAKEFETQLTKQISAIAKLGGVSESAVRDLPEDLYQAGVNAVEAEERFRQVRVEVERLNTASEKLTRISTVLFASGTAIVAGAALAAQNYVKFVEDAGIQGDETADRWIAASKRVKNAQLNLGQASAQALLPVYEELAALAEKVASFANAHPELVSAAINTGAVVAVVGAIGLAVSKGIRLVADFKYLAATTEYSLATTRFQNSVHEFLAGSKLTGQNTLASGAGTFAKVAVGVATLAAVNIGIAKEFDLIEKTLNEKVKGLGTGVTNAIGNILKAVPGLPLVQPFRDLEQALRRDIPLISNLAKQIFGLGEDAEKAADDIKNTDLSNSGLRDFQKEANLAQATQSFIQYRQQEADAEQQYMDQRAQIVQQGAAQLAQIESNYSQQRTQLAQQFATSSAQALNNFNYQRQQALEQFNRSEARALDEYNQSRSEARETYQEEEQRSQEDHLREMRRMEEESLDRQRELTASRDALGLVKERRDLARRQRDAEEDYGVERRRRRQDLQQRLRDMDEGFRQERQRRSEDFAYQQAQALEQFNRQQEQAQRQYEERLRQMDEQHRQEMLKARQQTTDRLREIDLQHRQEQIRRRNAFYDILRDLDANLLNEQETRKQYYARMQQDLINFLSSTASSANRGSNLPGYQSGGYTPEGAVRAHRGEWVATRETTSALERMVGGRLSQEGVRSIGSRSHTQISINARFDRMPAPWEAEQLKQVIVDTVEGLVT